ncbi:fatty acid metabolism transcriptional regulator FadR [Desulfosporosinus burensis]
MEEALKSPVRSSDLVENKLIRAVLFGEFPPGSELPPERDLAAKLGVGRPTLREVIQRLERDGWFTVRKGQHTLVKDFWREGNLNTLVNIVQSSEEVPEDFIINLLEVRAVLAPAYVKDAVFCCPAKVVAALTEIDELQDNAEVFALFDWQLQKRFVDLAKNPIYRLILNSFGAIYIQAARRYFMVSENRLLSRQFYQDLLTVAMASDYQGAEKETKEVMEAVLYCYKKQIK